MESKYSEAKMEEDPYRSDESSSDDESDDELVDLPTRSSHNKGRRGTVVVSIFIHHFMDYSGIIYVLNVMN